MSCGLVNTFQWFIADRRSAEADADLWRVRGEGEVADRGGGGWDGSCCLLYIVSIIARWFDLPKSRHGVHAPICFFDAAEVCMKYLWSWFLGNLTDFLSSRFQWKAVTKRRKWQSKGQKIFLLPKAIPASFLGIISNGGARLRGKHRGREERVWLDERGRQKYWQGCHRHRKCQPPPLFSWSDMKWWIAGFWRQGRRI